MAVIGVPALSYFTDVTLTPPEDVSSTPTPMNMRRFVPAARVCETVTVVSLDSKPDASFWNTGLSGAGPVPEAVAATEIVPAAVPKAVRCPDAEAATEIVPAAVLDGVAAV